MITFYALGALAVAALFVYLIIALLKPEIFP
jgi:K+-transporting ATPase KdpF subunit